ncbi:prepilin peptidase [Stakelama pacifica]|uniref:Prepilin peptidase CpaA n=1 Tax=Stakelama pacifica TaxID=517720 RepID=A0A4V6PRA6_9SPHN|nr:prepilin peptidase [Stakelama pacifica]TDN83728.1 prepilin peptidase CpaA [Stakelama pacifica]GGO94651.1 peptidase [Stakelama pacifica]
MANIFVPALLALLVALLLWAGVEDVRRREIANWKNAVIALLAPLWWVALGLPLWPAMAIQFALGVVVLLLFGLAFALGQMGGGDVKLLAALALWLPLRPLISMLVLMALIGGVLTLAMMAGRHLRRSEGPLEVPYGVAIVLACLITLREPILNQFS